MTTFIDIFTNSHLLSHICDTLDPISTYFLRSANSYLHNIIPFSPIVPIHAIAARDNPALVALFDEQPPTTTQFKYLILRSAFRSFTYFLNQHHSTPIDTLIKFVAMNNRPAFLNIILDAHPDTIITSDHLLAAAAANSPNAAYKFTALPPDLFYFNYRAINYAGSIDVFDALLSHPTNPKITADVLKAATLAGNLSVFIRIFKQNPKFPIDALKLHNNSGHVHINTYLITALHQPLQWTEKCKIGALTLINNVEMYIPMTVYINAIERADLTMIMYIDSVGVDPSDEYIIPDDTPILKSGRYAAPRTVSFYIHTLDGREFTERSILDVLIENFSKPELRFECMRYLLDTGAYITVDTVIKTIGADNDTSYFEYLLTPGIFASMSSDDHREIIKHTVSCRNIKVLTLLKSFGAKFSPICYKWARSILKSKIIPLHELYKFLHESLNIPFYDDIYNIVIGDGNNDIIASLDYLRVNNCPWDDEIFDADFYITTDTPEEFNTVLIALKYFIKYDYPITKNTTTYLAKHKRDDCIAYIINNRPDLCTDDILKTHADLKGITDYNLVMEAVKFRAFKRILALTENGSIQSMTAFASKFDILSLTNFTFVDLLAAKDNDNPNNEIPDLDMGVLTVDDDDASNDEIPDLK